MSIEDSKSPESRMAGFELKNVTGVLALAGTVLTALGFVSRYLSFRWSPNRSIGRSAIGLATMTPPTDWLATGVTIALLPAIYVAALTGLSFFAGMQVGSRLSTDSQDSESPCAYKIGLWLALLLMFASAIPLRFDIAARVLIRLGPVVYLVSVISRGTHSSAKTFFVINVDTDAHLFFNRRRVIGRGSSSA